LTACLTLVGTSMKEEDRAEWMRIARKTLSGIPADLLREGCAEARRKARFVGDIIPMIIGAVEERWDRRKRNAVADQQREWERQQAAMPRPKLEAPEYVDPEEVSKLIRSLGRGE
jgi:hypothetical protein